MQGECSAYDAVSYTVAFAGFFGFGLPAAYI